MKVNWSMGDGITYEDTRKVFHTYQDSGNFEIVIHAHDGSTSVEESFQINVRNMNPTILNIMMDETVNEGDELSFNVQYQDVPLDMDDISVRWIFPDGILEGNFVQYTFEDDGEFLISVEVKDDDGGNHGTMRNGYSTKTWLQSLLNLYFHRKESKVLLWISESQLQIQAMIQ